MLLLSAQQTIIQNLCPESLSHLQKWWEDYSVVVMLASTQEKTWSQKCIASGGARVTHVIVWKTNSKLNCVKITLWSQHCRVRDSSTNGCQSSKCREKWDPKPMCISPKGCNHFNTKTGLTDEKQLWDLASWLVGNLWLNMLCKTRKGLQLLLHRNLHTRFQLSQFALIVFNWPPLGFNSIPTNQQAPTHSFLDSIIKSKNQGSIFYNLKTITNHNAATRNN